MKLLRFRYVILIIGVLLLAALIALALMWFATPAASLSICSANAPISSNCLEDELVGYWR